MYFWVEVEFIAFENTEWHQEKVRIYVRVTRKGSPLHIVKGKQGCLRIIKDTFNFSRRSK